MAFVRRVFYCAAAWGLLSLPPMLFQEPPGLTEPAFYYGFIGVALAFQLVFAAIGREPERLRYLIAPCLFEKLSFVLSTFLLWHKGRAGAPIIYGAAADGVLSLLFIAAYFKLPAR